MTERLTCAVPGCKRTRHNREGYNAWICGHHWSMAPKKLKRQRTAAKRRKKYQLANWLWWRAVDDVTAQVLSGGDW